MKAFRALSSAATLKLEKQRLVRLGLRPFRALSSAERNPSPPPGSRPSWGESAMATGGSIFFFPDRGPWGNPDEIRVMMRACVAQRGLRQLRRDGL
jgi:hypothetical protein